MKTLAESVVEEAALAWLDALGYAVLHGPDIAAGEPGAGRCDPNYRNVVLKRRLRRHSVGMSRQGGRVAHAGIGRAIIDVPAGRAGS